METYLEISFDSGSTYQRLMGYEVLPDRLAIRLTADNLASIVAEGSDRIAHNLFRRLVDAASTVQMRLTCTVAAPDRNVAASSRSAAGTRFDQAGLVRRPGLGETRTVAPDSVLNVSDLCADDTDPDVAGDDLLAVAESLLDAHADRLVEGSLPIEWPEEPINLTDQVTRIIGLDYALGVNVGEAARYPRVIAVTRNLTRETYNCNLTLDTERKAGVV